MDSIYVKLDNNIGSIVASERNLNDERFVICDGHCIRSIDYPDFFAFYRSAKNTMTLPNYESIINGNIHFYFIAKQ